MSELPSEPIQLLIILSGAISAMLLSWWVMEKLRDVADEFGTLDIQHVGIFCLMLPLARRLGRVQRIVNLLPLQQYQDWLAKQLHVSGLDSIFRPADYVGSHGVLCLVGMAIPIIVVGHHDLAFSLVLALILGSGFLLLPFYYLSAMISERKKQLFISLPYFLDLLTLLVESGMEFTLATQRAARMMQPGPLKTEIERFNSKLQLGTSRRGALKELSSRCDLREMNGFVVALLQQQEIGSPMGEVLRTQSEIMRFSRVQRAEEHANKTPVLILVPMILFIFPATFLVIVGPLVIRSMVITQ